MKECHVKEPLCYTYFSTTWRKCLNSVNLWNCATLHTIQSLVVHRNIRYCTKISKKMIRRFYDIIKWFYVFHRFADLQSLAFFWKLTVEQYFKSLANKSNWQELPFLHFLQYDPKEMRVLSNLIFLVLG